jgi:hypothetical protein
MSQKRINQLPDLITPGDDNNDFLIVQKWEGQGSPDLSTNTGWKTYTARLGQYFSTFFGAINSLALWIANPISTDAGNTASLGSDAKVYVPAPPANASFYATTAASDVVGYTKLVISTVDPSYDNPAVDVSTGAITAFGQPVGALVSAPGVFVGNPGVVTITTTGEIRRTSGNGTAEFYFEAYHRDAFGTETLIGTSNVTPPISTSAYTQFTANCLINNGDFISTDRLVIKYFANRIAGGSNPVYEFSFGGANPVTTLFPVPAGVIAPPISSDPGNNATIGSDGKIFVPTPVIAQDFETLATQGSPVTISNTSAETIYPTNLLVQGAKNLVGAMYELHFNLSKGAAGHSSTIRIYINTANNLTGSPVKVLEYGSGFNSNTSFPFMFRYFRNSVGLVVPRDVNAAGAVLGNLNTQSLVSTTPITFNPNLTYYFVITTQMNVTTSSETLQFAKLCLNK